MSEEMMNIPKFFYTYNGLEVIKVEVNKFNISANMVDAYVNGSLNNKHYQLALYYDIDANQYSAHNVNSFKDTHLTYAEASAYLMNDLLTKDRITSLIYSKYKYNMNKCISEQPSIFI